MILVVLCLVLSTAACGHSANERSSGSSTAQVAESSVPSDPVTAANDAVPAAWKSKLTFAMVATTIGPKSKMSLPIPIGWQARAEEWAGGHFHPPSSSSADWGGSTDFYVGLEGGEGEQKSADAWSKDADRLFGIVFHPALSPKTIKDERTDVRHTMIASMHGQTTLMTAWWKDGGSYLYQCSVVVPDSNKELIPAFERSCLGAQVQ